MKNPYRNGTTLLPDYHTFRKIWSHPKVLEFAYNAAWNDFQNKVKAQDLHSNNGDSSDDEDFRLARNGELIIANNFDQTKLPMYSPLNGWWKEQVTQEQRDSILSSNKFKILFDIVNTCELQNEKCLIFSEYTKVLDAVEFAMKQITKEVDSSECFEGFEEYHCEVRKWVRAHDYCRLDGSTSQTDRFDLINRFNHPDEKRLRVFLISSKAGGQGINLVAATRVILLDTAWNPSNDREWLLRMRYLVEGNSVLLVFCYRAKHFSSVSNGPRQELLHLSLVGHGNHGRESILAVGDQTGDKLSCDRQTTSETPVPRSRIETVVHVRI